MKLSNFKLTRTEGTSALDKVFFALVEVETGAFFWRRKKHKAIRRVFANYWHFVESGEYTPESQAETLARAWSAQTGQET